jgi:hypothetical protein
MGGKHLKKFRKIYLHEDNTDFGFRTFQQVILYNPTNQANLMTYLEKQQYFDFAQSKTTLIVNR